MRYEVLRHSYGYKGRRWYKGELINLSDEETPPVDLFRPLDRPTPPVPPPPPRPLPNSEPVLPSTEAKKKKSRKFYP